LGFIPISLKQLINSLEAGAQLPRRAFVVTFDDVYENVFLNAFPILKDLKIPATLFVATKFLDGEEPFPFDDTCSAAPDEYPHVCWRPIRVSQCREMIMSDLIEIGCHTNTHSPSYKNADEFHADVLASLEILKREFDIDQPSFAFPYGRYNDKMVEVIRTLGCSCALTGEPVTVSYNGDLLRIGRFNVDEHETAHTLSLKINGWFEWFRTHANSQTLKLNFMALIGQAFLAATAIVTNFLVGSSSKIELGIFYLTYNILNIAQIVQKNCIGIPYSIFMHQTQPDDAPLLAGSTLAHQAAFSLAAVSLVGTAAAGAMLTQRGELFVPILTAAAIIPFFSLRFYFRQYHIAHLHLREAVAIDIAVASAQLTILFLLFSTSQINAASASLSVAVSSLIGALVSWSLVGKNFSFKCDRAMSDWFRAWNFAKWSLTSELVGSISLLLIPWTLALKMGLDQAGIFAAASTVVGIGQLAINASASIMLPQAAHAFSVGGWTKLLPLLRVQFVSLATVIILFGIAAAAVGEQLIFNLLNWNDEIITELIVLLAVSQLFGGLGLIAVIGLYAINKPRLNLPADILLMLSMVLSAPSLIDEWGVLGAAASMAIASVVGAVVRFKTLARQNRLSQAN
jgi:peptidoglycan/xylan/chitin deacetylase (PgdA/CDA1 family)/O-antigen/teichoic acid export membrane protein